MSAISHLQSKGYHNFSIEKPTQYLDKRLLIEQSSEGLKVSVQDQKSGKIYQIERHMIDGLPKTDLIPKEFFDCFYARVSTLVPEGHKVCFSGRLRGGMMRGSHLDIDSVIAGVEKSNKQTRKAHHKECVLIIGDTGVGKSTLANAMVKGPKALVIKEKKEQGRFGEYTTTYIDTKEPIVERDGTVIFGIGHGKAQSMTQHPEIFIDRDIAYCDCPGFGDTSGENRDLVNCVGIKDILNNAKNVRILLALSATQILETAGRGQAVRNAVSTLNTIFSNHNFSMYVNSIVPVVLRSPIGTPVVNIRQALFESMQKENFEQIGEQLARNLVVVDPLERCQSGELTLDQFRKACLKAQPLMGIDFGDPLTAESITRLSAIFTEISSSIKDFSDKGSFEEAEVELEKLSRLNEYKFPLVCNFFEASKTYIQTRREVLQRNLDIESIEKQISILNQRYAECVSEIQEIHKNITDETEKKVDSESGFWNGVGRGVMRTCGVVNYVNPVSYAMEGAISLATQENHMMMTKAHNLPEWQYQKSGREILSLNSKKQSLETEMSKITASIKAFEDRKSALKSL
jgi:GTPase SAR1 family protein